ncbi:peptide N-acetyl-beta-D-glucosaminyl asparaginase amidase A-domain-containing protein [Rhodocollybia butyracea]|uniref:Peptide N-acetyl-beta-D-glucosaminyl asparaginase amidase A-domain-containing protein n=1 Tax=Rhodocollybia butyracea TaxID=206335 RepID=A0A9P5U773_9AGAR|nr:peptide N-acetyl-beta-D-glucosaminyl asparaginase amidase A-domain-containing protein [Rhodocollybia butyracea]
MLTILWSILSLTLTTVTGTVIRDFQVGQPPVVPKDAKQCRVEVFQHDFANSFDTGSAITQLNPPTDCGDIGSWAAITLNLTVTSNGTQFDRLGIFTFHNVEIWRTSTFEPTIGDGIIWTYVKDATQYMPLFSEAGLFIFELDNLIETGLDGVYSTVLTATYYESSRTNPAAKKADLIIPISTLSNTTGNDASVPPDFSLNITIPNNTVAIYAELFASGNGLEEDWFFNVPDKFFSDISSNITSAHDGFREVRLLVDGMVAGVAFPYITVFSGGFDPSCWRPIGSYGMADLPTYAVDLTPFLPILTDNSPHNFTLDVVSAEANHSINANWFVSGNLQVILDSSSKPTTGNITVYSVNDFADTSITGSATEFGTFNATVTAKREIHIEADILSGSGHLTHTVWTQDLQFSNVQTYRNNGLFATLQQTSTGKSSSTHNGVPVLSDVFSFPFSTNFDYFDETLTNWTTSIDHSYDRVLLPNPLRIASTINNHQTTNGFFQVGSEKSGNFGNGTNSNTFTYSDVEGNTYTRKINVANTNFNDTIIVFLDEISGSLASTS